MRTLRDLEVNALRVGLSYELGGMVGSHIEVIPREDKSPGVCAGVFV
jgi:hypothetical protein